MLDYTSAQTKQLLGLLFLLVWAPAAHSQRRQTPLTRVTGVASDYCKVDSDVTAIHLRITVQLTNRTKQSLVILRQVDGADAVWVKDLTGRNVLQLDLGHKLYTKGDLVSIGDIPDSHLFEVLLPTSSTERVISFPIFIRVHAVSPTPGFLSPGTYELRATASTEPPFAGNDLHIKQALDHWNKLGMFLLRRLAIASVSVRILPPENPAACD